MGGRGSGVNIIGVGQIRGRDAKPAEWISVIADLNRAASGRMVDRKAVLTDFADASREKYDGKVEVLGIMHDEGHVLKALKGDDGVVKYNAEQRREMSGHDITHYHNRSVPSAAEKKEIEEDTEQYKGVMRALSSYMKGRERYAEADKQAKNARQGLKRFTPDTTVSGADKALQGNQNAELVRLRNELADAERESDLALRQIDRARSTFQERADKYDKNGVKPNRIPKRFASLTEISVPIRKIDTRDETGYIGGCFSGADLSSDLVAKDIPSFHACGDEGDYEVRPLKRATTGDIDRARSRIQSLWRQPKDWKSAKKELDSDAYKFQRHLRGIDMKTNEEGRKKKWPMQKRRAISFNRQMAYAWEVQKAIVEDHNISATFTPNPNYKPVFMED